MSTTTATMTTTTSWSGAVTDLDTALELHLASADFDECYQFCAHGHQLDHDCAEVVARLDAAMAAHAAGKVA